MTNLKKDICERCSLDKIPFMFSPGKTGMICKNSGCIEELLKSQRLNRYPYNFLYFAKDNMRYLNACLWDQEITNKHFYDFWKMGRRLHKQNFIIIGNVGVGKTHSLWAFFRNVCMSSPILMPRIISETNFYKGLKREMSLGMGAESSPFYEQIIQCDFLFFDDLGSSKKTYQNEWAQQIMFDFVDNRYNSQKPTVFTTNFDFEDLDFLGERTMDRLKTWQIVKSDRCDSFRKSSHPNV